MITVANTPRELNVPRVDMFGYMLDTVHTHLSYLSVTLTRSHLRETMLMWLMVWRDAI